MTFNDNDDDDKLSNLPEGITIIRFLSSSGGGTRCHQLLLYFFFLLVVFCVAHHMAHLCLFLVIIISEGNCCCSPSLCRWPLKVRPILSDSHFTKKFDTQRVQVCQAPAAALTLATSELSSLRIGTLLLEN